jgi:hypothetical protein
LSQSIRNKEHKVNRKQGDAIEGDIILIECRKPCTNWQSTRGSQLHNYFMGTVRKNAYAVVSKTFTNVRTN